MIRSVFAVKDALRGFGNPLVNDSEALAIRDFRYAIVNDPMLRVNARDYDLYVLASFDTESGFFQSLSIPKIIMRGIDCLPAEEQVGDLRD